MTESTSNEFPDAKSRVVARLYRLPADFMAGGDVSMVELLREFGYATTESDVVEELARFVSSRSG